MKKLIQEIYKCLIIRYINLPTVRWYNEYSAHIRIHDYFCIMIDQFPVIVFRKIDNPHSENDNMDAVLLIGIFGFTWYKKLNKNNENR